MPDSLFDELTPTQIRTCEWLVSRSRVLLLSGDVRAGKTVGLCWLASEWTQQFPGAQHVALGRSLSALRRNVLPHLKVAAASLGLHYRKRENGREVEVGNGVWHLIGIPNIAALDGVWGAEFTFGLIDDATRITPEAIQVALTRFNRPKSKLAITCNPASPNHLIKRRYFDRATEIAAVRTHADIRDNPSITPEVLRGLERELYGHHRQRALFGEWVGAVGMIYEIVPETALLPPRPDGRVVVGVDFGMTNATAAVVLVEVGEGQWQIQGEYHYAQGNRTVDDHVKAIKALCDEFGTRRVHVDPSAKALAQSLRRADLYAPKQSKRASKLSVADGIALVNATFRDGNLTVAAGTAPNLMEEAASYEWDEAATERGEDKPLKQNDHALDALRYAGVEVLRRYRLANWYGDDGDDADDEDAS